MKRTFISRVGLLGLLLFIAAPLGAQEEVATRPTALGVRQQQVQRMMENLERKFKELAQSLEQSEPERSQRLIHAIQESKQLLIQQRMDEIVALLNRTQLDAASGGQKQVIDDLQRLIDLLLQEPTRYDDKISELEQLEKWREEIRDLIARQAPQLSEAERIANRDETLAELASQIAALEQLIARQQQVVEQGSEARTGGVAAQARVADAQHEVRNSTEELARRLGESGKPSGAPPAEGEPSSGQPSSGQPSGGSPQSPPKPGQRKVEQAAQRQQQAEQGWQQGKPADAQRNGDQALQDLKGALAELQREESRIASLPPEMFEEMAKEQDQLAEAAGKLAEEMSGQGGGQGAGSPSGKPSPGQGGVQEAGKSMEKASGGLREQDPSDAARNQGKAIRELEQALQEIEERLAQLRDETQIEKLARLEARFREMLARQQPLTSSTAAVQQRRTPDGFTRQDNLEIGRIAGEELRLAESAQLALEIILEDGTSVVFPHMVQQLHDDLLSVSDLLEARRADSYTQFMQREIETNLEELIAALQRAKKQVEQQQQGGGQCSCDEPLLPSSAELKLLRASQLRVNRRTAAFAESQTAEEVDAAQQRELEGIARRQQEIADLTLEILERN